MGGGKGKGKDKGKGKGKPKKKGGGRPVMQNQVVANWFSGAAAAPPMGSHMAAGDISAPQGSIGRGRPVPAWATAAQAASEAVPGGAIGRGVPLAAWKAAELAAVGQRNPELATTAIDPAGDAGFFVETTEDPGDAWEWDEAAGWEWEDTAEGSWEADGKSEAGWENGWTKAGHEDNWRDSSWNAPNGGGGASWSGSSWPAKPPSQEENFECVVDWQGGSGIEVMALQSFYESEEWLETEEGEALLLLHEHDGLAYCKAHGRPDCPTGWVPCEYLTPIEPRAFQVALGLSPVPGGLGLHVGRTRHGLLVLRVLPHSACEIHNKRKSGQVTRIFPGDLVTEIFYPPTRTNNVLEMETILMETNAIAKSQQAQGQYLEMHVLRRNHQDDLPPLLDCSLPAIAEGDTTNGHGGPKGEGKGSEDAADEDDDDNATFSKWQ